MRMHQKKTSFEIGDKSGDDRLRVGFQPEDKGPHTKAKSRRNHQSHRGAGVPVRQHFL